MKIIVGARAAETVNPFYVAHGATAFARPEDLFFTAFDGDELIGSVRFCVEEKTPMLRSMMIHEGYRKRGVGQALLGRFETYLDEQAFRLTHCLPYGHLVAFYGQIGFGVIPEIQAPPFLLERLAGYRTKNPTVDYICMRRP
ncbi:hypothetical protein BH10BDE1_BH10BDE1_07510 [soil metagenome]